MTYDYGQFLPAREADIILFNYFTPRAFVTPQV